MKTPLSLILAAILLITCSGCIWGWDRGRGGHDDRDSGVYDDRDRHDDRRDSDHHR